MTDSIQTNMGLCLVSSIVMLLPFICHQHEHGRHFEIPLMGLMPCQQYFRYIKVTNHRIVLPVRSLGLGKMCGMRGVLQLFQKSPFLEML